MGTLSDTDLHTKICDALKRRNLDVELMDTGGGILVTAAVYLRAGSAGVFLPGYGETAPDGTMIRYFGVTLEDEWIVCEYREDSDDLRYTDGVVMDTSGISTDDIDGVAALVARLVAERNGEEIPVAPQPMIDATHDGLTPRGQAILDAAEAEWYAIAKGDLVTFEDEAEEANPTLNETVRVILTMADWIEATGETDPERIGKRIAAAFTPLVFPPDDAPEGR